MSTSSIEWTELTWNPTTGCTKISAGCKFCYAEIMTRRLKAMGQSKYSAGFKKVEIHPLELKRPYTWKNPSIVFVNSMSDLFHPEVPLHFIKKVFQVMKENPQHTFQVLTKRADRLLELDQLDFLDWSDNIWIGTSVEDERVLERVEFLSGTKAHIKFLSCEPLIGPLKNLRLNNIDWVIVGGESGHTPREIKEEWILEIKQKCKKAKVPFFFKQWGGKNKKKSGRLLQGETWDEMPEISNFEV